MHFWIFRKNWFWRFFIRKSVQKVPKKQFFRFFSYNYVFQSIVYHPVSSIFTEIIWIIEIIFISPQRSPLPQLGLISIKNEGDQEFLYFVQTDSVSWLVKFEHVPSAPVAISKLFRVILAITNQSRAVILIFLRNTCFFCVSKYI